MNRIFYMAAVALLCTSCFHVNKNYTGGKNAIKGTGAVISKTLDFKDFDTIEINGGADVTFTQAEGYEVTVRTQESVFEWLDYSVEGTKLILQTKDKKAIHAEVFEITVTAPELNKVVVNGASDFDIKGLRIDGDLDVQVNGAGDLDFDQVACESLFVEVNGAGDAKLTSLNIRKKLKVCRHYRQNPGCFPRGERRRRHRRYGPEGGGRSEAAQVRHCHHPNLNFS